MHNTHPTHDFRNMSQIELDKTFSWGNFAPVGPEKPAREVVRITYEVAGDEPLHPDPTVCARMREIGLSDCGYGCKVYADPHSNVRVLAHNRAYGCPK